MGPEGQGHGDADGGVPQRAPSHDLTSSGTRLGSWSVRRPSDLAGVRHAAAEVLGTVPADPGEAGPDPVSDLHDPVVRLTLVVSELATNALKYGSGLATVTVTSVPDRGWLVDTHDANVRDYPRPHRLDPLRPGQHGLLLVTTLCPTWGWYVDSWTRRKHVWALVPLA